MRHRDCIERPFQLLLPEGKEILQSREFWKQVVVLPDIGLQQRGMIRHPVKDLRRCQPVTQHLFPKVLGNNSNPRTHANLHFWSALSGWQPGSSHPVKMRSHEPNVTLATNSSQAKKFKVLLKFAALAATYRTC